MPAEEENVTEPTPLLEYANPLADQPIGSRAVCERHEDGRITFTLPPEGVGRMMPSLIVMAVPVVLLLVLGVAAAVASIGMGMVLFLAALPLGALWAALLRSATQPTVVAVRAGQVILESGAALWSPRRVWPVGEVTGVRVSLSGASLRARFVGDLVLRMQRRDANLIVGGDKAELEWVARGLREALRLPAV